MSLEPSIPRELCSSCMDCPWGDSGWKAFFDESGGSAKLTRNHRSIRNMIEYDVETQTLYEQSRDCKWCYMLVAGIKIDLPDGVGFEHLQEWGYDRTHVTMKFHAPLQGDPVKLNSVHVSLRVNGPENRFNMFRLDRLAVWSKPGSLGSDTFFSLSERGDRGPGFDADLASTWINTCRDNHGRCQGDQGSSRMPTRILDLSGPIESDFKLRATKFEGENTEYACLSYKWGNTNRLDVNFPDLARSMFDQPMSPQDERLPPTFRDAIKVARSIGISYLWIDALCIWQDKDDDKRLELEKMNRYYANCSLVIQASGTESVSESFLDLAYRSRNRDVFETYLEPFPLKSSDGQEDSIYVCPGEKLDWYRKCDQPAAKRGWILQEETLCRRILMFPAGGGMIFCCDSRDMETDDGNVFYDPDVHDPPRYWTKDRLLERTEDISPALIPLSGRTGALMESVRSLSEVQGLKPSLWLIGRKAVIQFGGDDDADEPSEGFCLTPVQGASAKEAALAKTMALLRPAGGPDSLVFTQTPPGVSLPNELHDIWKHLVTDYCARDLTNWSDKLIAIDALAREFQERYGRALGSYHAGLWSNFAPAGLLWHSIRPAPPDAEFSVPSWSWAAVRGASYPEPGRHTGELGDGADFEDVDIQLSPLVSAEEGADEVKQIRLVTKLLDVWWGADTTPEQEGVDYALFQDNGEALNTKKVYPDHSVDLPLCDRQSVAMMLGRRYVMGIGHDKNHFGEVLLLRKREYGGYVRVAFAIVLFEDFEEKWEPRFRVETIVLA